MFTASAATPVAHVVATGVEKKRIVTNGRDIEAKSIVTERLKTVCSVGAASSVASERPSTSGCVFLACGVRREYLISVRRIVTWQCSSKRAAVPSTVCFFTIGVEQKRRRTSGCVIASGIEKEALQRR